MPRDSRLFLGFIAGTALGAVVLLHRRPFELVAMAITMVVVVAIGLVMSDLARRSHFLTDPPWGSSSFAG